MKPSTPWERTTDGEIAYRKYVSVFYDCDMYICIFPMRNEIIIHDCIDGATKWLQFPKHHYRKLEAKKAYVELMLRLGEWDKILEDI